MKSKFGYLLLLKLFLKRDLHEVKPEQTAAPKSALA
jgi:hypothetical protein